MSAVEQMRVAAPAAAAGNYSRHQDAVQRVSVALLGYGRVGQAVAAVAAAEHQRLRDAGIQLRVTGALIRDPAKGRLGPPIPLHTTAASLFATRADVVIDVMGGEHPANELVTLAIESGAHVVSANKTLVAARGRELRALAARRGVAFVYDAAVLAGVPFLGALSRRPLIGSPVRITGIINGTSHFVTSQLARGGSLDAAVAEAVAHGYAEPDSSADLSGRDAAEKLTILLHLCGCRDLAVADLLRCHLDRLQPGDVLGARALGGIIKPVAVASLDSANPGAWVGPALVDRAHPFAPLTGVGNAIQFASDIGDPVTFAGPGAGPRVTAATILDDVAEAALGGSRASVSAPAAVPLPASFRRPPAGRWYVRAVSAHVTSAGLIDALAANGVAASRALECGRAVVARTGAAPWSAITAARQRLAESGHDVLVLPILDTTN